MSSKLLIHDIHSSKELQLNLSVKHSGFYVKGEADLQGRGRTRQQPGQPHHPPH